MAVNAITPATGRALAGGFVAMQGAAFLAALVIVGDDDGVFVEQCGLQAAIRADERAGLFAEAGEDAVEEQREQAHE